MNKFRPGLIVILVCCALFAAEINCGQNAVMYSATLTGDDANPPIDKMSHIAGNSYVPRKASRVLQESHEKYLQGCAFYEAGDSEKARQRFNEAVDLLLSPNWDRTSTLHLNHFFQELVKKIPKERNLDSRIAESADHAEASIPLKISPSIKDEIILQLVGARTEIPITVNRTVAKSLYYWLNDGQHFLLDGLRRSGLYRPIIERIFREESVPLDLMYLAQVESLFKPTACSQAGAKGIWQFNVATAIQYGLKVTPDVDERSDPEKSTRAAARYLKDLYAEFGDWNLALAAYNWGDGRVRRLVQTTGIRDFWKIIATNQRLPKETKNYIPLIDASIILARYPEKFGLDLEMEPPVEYIEISIPRPIDLRAAAQVLNTTVDELKLLNPSLRGIRTPAGYPDYRLKVPAESDINLRERLVTLSVMSEPSLAQANRQSVLNGEDLMQIASRN